METYQKINTLYKRYQFNGKDCPNKKWLAFKNKIILGDFSNKEAEYLFDCLWIAESKLDGTNSKIAYFPLTKEVKFGGKSDEAQSMHGQFEMLEEIANRIKPMLEEMFPTPTPTEGVEKVEEKPIYIYGEYYGNGIQKCGKRYSNDNHFRVFDVKIGNWWTPIETRNEICKKLGLDVVPTVGVMTLRDAEKMVRGGFTTKLENAVDPTLLEEGLVCRTLYNFRDESGKRIIVKVKYCDYVEYDSIRKDFTDEEFKEFNKWYHETIES